MRITIILTLILAVACPWNILAEEFVVLFPALGNNYARTEDLHKHFDKCSQNFARALEERSETPDSVEYLFVINGAIVNCNETLIRDIADSPSIESISTAFPVYPPRTTTSTDFTPDSKAIHTKGVALINAPAVWDEMGYDGKGVVIGHIDTGINADHDDIKGKVLRFKDFVVPSNTLPNDNGGHGTHTGGTIVGGNSSGKYIGVAPGAKLIVAKAIGYGKSSANLLKAMDWMCDPDGNPETNDVPTAVSCSWRSGGGDQTPFYRAVETWVNLGIFPCFSAGNSGSGSSTITPPKEFPLAFCSAAVDFNDKIASFSSRGPGIWGAIKTDKPDVAGPGKDVYSSDRSGAFSVKSGTSMACPHTAGVIALMTQANPVMTVRDKMKVLKETSVDLGSTGFDYTYGNGRIDAPAAVNGCLTGTILEGQVVSSDDDSPISAHITITGTDTAIDCDSNGNFKIYLQNGSYELTVSAFGFLPTSAQVLLENGSEPDTLSITLSKADFFEVSGVVTSLVTNSPVKGSIAVLKTPVNITSNDDGTYALKLPQGNHTFTVSSPNHQQMTFTNVEVVKDIVLNFNLEAIPPVLLVDDDQKRDYEDYYKAALDYAQVKFNYLDRTEGPLRLKDIAVYDTVLWFTGNDRTTTIESADQTLLTEYLATGGKVILFGENIAYNLRYRRFLRDIIKGKYLGDSTELTDLRGFSSFFDLRGGDGASNMRRPDRVKASSPAMTKTIVKYKNGDGAALYTDASTGEVALFGFGLESVARRDDRNLILSEILKIMKSENAELFKRLVLLPANIKHAYYTSRIETCLSREEISKAAESSGTESLLRAIKVINNYKVINN